MVQSCTASSNHISSQLFFTLSLCWLPRRQWSLRSGAMVWRGCVSFLSLLASSEWNFTTWTPDRLLSCCKCARSQAVHVQPVCMHPCKRAVAPVAVSPDPRRPTCSHHSLSLCDPVTPGRSRARESVSGDRKTCISGQAWTSRRASRVMS